MKDYSKNTIFNKYFEMVEELIHALPTMEERAMLIEEINELHFQEIGEPLPSYLLELLGTWYLKETYSDKRTNKVALEEYPVLSESQLLRRKRKVVQIAEENTLEVLNYHLRNNSSTSKRTDEPKEGGTFNEYNN